MPSSRGYFPTLPDRAIEPRKSTRGSEIHSTLFINFYFSIPPGTPRLEIKCKAKTGAGALRKIHTPTGFALGVLPRMKTQEGLAPLEAYPEGHPSLYSLCSPGSRSLTHLGLNPRDVCSGRGLGIATPASFASPWLDSTGRHDSPGCRP